MTICQDKVAFDIDVENGRLVTMRNLSDRQIDVVIPYKFSANCRIKSIGRGFCDGVFGTVKISDNITEVNDFAFSNAHVNEVVWSSGCKTIPKHCFSDGFVKKLSNIEDVEYVLDFAFSFSIIEDIRWPSKCQTIPSGCFHSCMACTVSGIDNVVSISESAFSYSRVGEIVWPSSCSVIPPVCFKESRIKSISNLGGVKEIGYGAFNGARGLEKIDLSQAIISDIGNAAFRGINRSKVILPYYLCEDKNFFD